VNSWVLRKRFAGTRGAFPAAGFLEAGPAGRGGEGTAGRSDWYGSCGPHAVRAAGSSRNVGGICGCGRDPPATNLSACPVPATTHDRLVRSGCKAGADLGVNRLVSAVLDDIQRRWVRCFTAGGSNRTTPGVARISPATSRRAPLQPQ